MLLLLLLLLMEVVMLLLEILLLAVACKPQRAHAHWPGESRCRMHRDRPLVREGWREKERERRVGAGRGVGGRPEGKHPHLLPTNLDAKRPASAGSKRVTSCTKVGCVMHKGYGRAVLHARSLGRQGASVGGGKILEARLATLEALFVTGR